MMLPSVSVAQEKFLLLSKVHNCRQHCTPIFPTDPIHSIQTEESFSRPKSLKDDMRRPAISHSGRAPPDRSKMRSKNISITDNAPTKVKHLADELICTLQNSELRACPAAAISANASCQSPHIAGSFGNPFAHKNEFAEDNKSTSVSCPAPLHISLQKSAHQHIRDLNGDSPDIFHPINIHLANFLFTRFAGDAKS